MLFVLMFQTNVGAILMHTILQYDKRVDISLVLQSNGAFVLNESLIDNFPIKLQHSLS